MKEIRLLAWFTDMEEPNIGSLGLMIDPTLKNKGQIIEAALVLERLVCNVISAHFFDPSDPRRAEFEAEIVHTSWCGFADKLKLLRHVTTQRATPCDAADEKRAAKKRIDALCNSLMKVMHRRNAFTHGSFSTDGRSVWLSYYQNGPKRLELTDGELAAIEDEIAAAWTLMGDLLREMKVPTPTRNALGERVFAWLVFKGAPPR